MSDMKSIWHKLPEQPEKGRDVLEKLHHLGIHYTHFVAKNGIAEDNPFTDAWCYLDDLLALETELERTHKALDVANEKLRHCVNMTEEELDELKGNLLIAWNALVHFSKDPIADDALKKITALEQKDVK